jgi:hypothetical protein
VQCRNYCIQQEEVQQQQQASKILEVLLVIIKVNVVAFFILIILNVIESNHLSRLTRSISIAGLKKKALLINQKCFNYVTVVRINLSI